MNFAGMCVPPSYYHPEHVRDNNAIDTGKSSRGSFALVAPAPLVNKIFSLFELKCSAKDAQDDSGKRGRDKSYLIPHSEPIFASLLGICPAFLK